MLEFCDDWRAGLAAAVPTPTNAQLWVAAKQAIRTGGDGRLKQFLDQKMPRFSAAVVFGEAQLVAMVEAVERLFAPRITYEETLAKWIGVSQGPRAFEEFFAEFSVAVDEVDEAAASGLQIRAELTDETILERLENASAPRFKEVLRRERELGLWDVGTRTQREDWRATGNRLILLDDQERSMQHRLTADAALAKLDPTRPATPAASPRASRKRTAASPKRLLAVTPSTSPWRGRTWGERVAPPRLSPGGPLANAEEETQRPTASNRDAKRERRTGFQQKCFSCQQVGHRAQDCPHKEQIAKFLEQFAAAETIHGRQ